MITARRISDAAAAACERGEREVREGTWEAFLALLVQEGLEETALAARAAGQQGWSRWSGGDYPGWPSAAVGQWAWEAHCRGF